MQISQEESQPSNYETIVLCGGYGSRMVGLTGDELPKHLLALNGVTVLEHALQPFTGTGRFIFATSNHAYQIIDFAEKRFGEEKVAQSYQETPGGVVSAVRQAITEDVMGPTVVLTHGDEVVPGLQLTPMIATHLAHQRVATVLLTTQPPAELDFVMTLDDSNAVQTLERDPTLMPKEGVQYGIGTFVLQREVCAYMEKVANWTDMLRSLIADQQLTGHVIRQPFFNVNTPADLVTVEAYLNTASFAL